MNVIGVDVGTTSVRLIVVNYSGPEGKDAKVLAHSRKEIRYFQSGNQYEQSSAEIWKAVCECSRECIEKMGSPQSIKGIAFSATCSLVIDGPTVNKDRDIIMWLDHRAIKEAQDITKSDSDVLKQFGGTCSPEFSLSKLTWLKNNQPDRFNAAKSFFELPDWLVYRCIGGQLQSLPRSTCCLICKWGYRIDRNQFCDPFKKVFEDPDNWSKISGPIYGPGTISGHLSAQAAKELGLVKEGEGTSTFDLRNFTVGTSLIDAHSGMLAMLAIGCDRLGRNIDNLICSLSGTSSCHLMLSKGRRYAHGIWGPYRDVILKDYYLLEAGQSMTGKLIDMTIQTHEEGQKMLSDGLDMYDIINSMNDEILKNGLKSSLHVLPSFHGNRSPLANPKLMGGIYGLTAEGTKNLLEHYIATIDSIAYEMKFIFKAQGREVKSIMLSGGLMKNTFYMQTLADVLQCQTIQVGISGVDVMVLGSSLVARHAAMEFKKGSSEQLGEKDVLGFNFEDFKFVVYEPNKERFAYHEKRFACYIEFVELAQRIDNILK